MTVGEPGQRRLFVGIALPNTIRSKLTALQEGLGNARWVLRENFHITLHFLGFVQEGIIPDIHESLSQVIGKRHKVSLQGVSFRRPEVVWVDVVSTDELLALKQQVDIALHRLGFEDKRTLFHPHVTIGRVRSLERKTLLPAYLNRMQNFITEKFAIESFVLFESCSTEQGIHYKPLVNYPLG